MKKAMLHTASLALCSLFLVSCATRTAYIPGPPPPPPVEYYGPAPGLGYYWVPGYYGYAGHRYHWHRGRWAYQGRYRR